MKKPRRPKTPHDPDAPSYQFNVRIHSRTASGRRELGYTGSFRAKNGFFDSPFYILLAEAARKHCDIKITFDGRSDPQKSG